jgi:hypothetical protein
MQHPRKISEMRMQFFKSENMKGRDNLEDYKYRCQDNIKINVMRYGMIVGWLHLAQDMVW